MLIQLRLANNVPLLRVPSFTCSLQTCDLHNFCGFACIDLNTQDNISINQCKHCYWDLIVLHVRLSKSQELPYGKGKIKTYLI